jgi:hypothetical protein
MSSVDFVWRSLGKGKAHPTEVINTLIEIENCKGLLGLCTLEHDLRAQLPRLRPQAQALAKTWLEAIHTYRTAYYPESGISKLFAHFKPQQKEVSLQLAS